MKQNPAACSKSGPRSQPECKKRILGAETASEPQLLCLFNRTWNSMFTSTYTIMREYMTKYDYDTFGRGKMDHKKTSSLFIGWPLDSVFLRPPFHLLIVFCLIANCRNGERADMRCILAICSHSCFWIIFQMICVGIPAAILFKFNPDMPFLRVLFVCDGPTDGHSL